MSLYKTYVINCDGRLLSGNHCLEFLQTSAPNKKAARIEARVKGWRRIRGFDLCTNYHYEEK